MKTLEERRVDYEFAASDFNMLAKALHLTGVSSTHPERAARNPGHAESLRGDLRNAVKMLREMADDLEWGASMWTYDPRSGALRFRGDSVATQHIVDVIQSISGWSFVGDIDSETRSAVEAALASAGPQDGWSLAVKLNQMYAGITQKAKVSP